MSTEKCLVGKKKQLDESQAILNKQQRLVKCVRSQVTWAEGWGRLFREQRRGEEWNTSQVMCFSSVSWRDAWENMLIVSSRNSLASFTNTPEPDAMGNKATVTTPLSLSLFPSFLVLIRLKHDRRGKVDTRDTCKPLSQSRGSQSWRSNIRMRGGGNVFCWTPGICTQQNGAKKNLEGENVSLMREIRQEHLYARPRYLK